LSKQTEHVIVIREYALGGQFLPIKAFFNSRKPGVFPMKSLIKSLFLFLAISGLSSLQLLMAATGGKTDGVYFKNLKDGDKVEKTFTVDFGVQGMTVKPAGSTDAKSGHHHIIIDGGSIAKGMAVPKDDKNKHYGKGEESTQLTLAPGPHTLTLQFADTNHLSYGPDWSKTIKIVVK
jgi:hypothetical protein